jgi:capsular polysaccharide biosynthesis protein
MSGRTIHPDETREQLSRVAAFLRRALRFWATSLSLLFLGGIACAVVLFVRRPMFRSETVILYSEGVRPGDDADRPDTTRSVTVRLKEILMSRASLDAVVQEFDLYPEIRRTRGSIDAVEELKKHIEFRAPGGDTFSLAFTGAFPSEARAVTARLAEVVISQDSDLRKKRAILVRDFLETEKATTEDGLRDAELALASFMAAHPRFALDVTPFATGAAIRASMGGSAVPSVPTLGVGSLRLRGNVRSPLPASTEGVSNPIAKGSPNGAREAAIEEAQAKAGLAAARANLTDLAARFTPVHPDVRMAQAEVERATNRLAAATAASAAWETIASAAVPAPQPVPSSPAAPLGSPPVAGSNLRPAVGPVGSAVIALPTIGEPRGSEHDVVALETDWVKLTRATTEARQHHDQVEAALFKAKSAANSENGNHGVQVTVIDPAFLPESSVPPGRTTIVALFAAISLLLAVAGAFLRALTDDRVYDERDIWLLAPVLVEVPRRAYAP